MQEKSRCAPALAGAENQFLPPVPSAHPRCWVFREETLGNNTFPLSGHFVPSRSLEVSPEGSLEFGSRNGKFPGAEIVTVYYFTLACFTSLEGEVLVKTYKTSHTVGISK